MERSAARGNSIIRKWNGLSPGDAGRQPWKTGSF